MRRRKHSLSGREDEFRALHANGLGSKEIAERMGLPQWFVNEQARRLKLAFNSKFNSHKYVACHPSTTGLTRNPTNV